MLPLRLPFAATSGALVTLVVFSVLWGLVSVPIDVGVPLPTTKIDFTRQRIETPTETKRKEKAQRPPQQKTPDPPRATATTGVNPPTRFQRASFDPVRLPRQSGVPMRPDGDAVPVVRITPDYPPQAITRGIEGWVQVRFTVTTIGTVRDALVVDAEPKKLFDDAALKAIARWRYNPKVDGGAAVERVGLQTVIRFQLDH
jgi:protein TonB